MIIFQQYSEKRSKFEVNGLNTQLKQHKSEISRKKTKIQMREKLEGKKYIR